MAQPIIPTLTAADQALAVSTLISDSAGRWNATSAKGTAVTVQYSFAASVPSYVGSYSETRTATATFASLDAATKTQTREALAAWSAVANIDFVEVADSTSVGMRFFSLSDPTLGAAGFAVGAGTGSRIGTGINGDVWVNRAITNPGYTPIMLMHEIGHTMGFKHPHENPALPDAKDSLQTTVMSYDQEYFYDLKVTVSGSNFQPEYVRLEDTGHAHLGIFDVAAAQALYGVRTNSLANTYRFETTPFTKMLYDGGGADVIDLSNQLYGSVLNLTPGTFSSIGKQSLAQAIAREIAELPAATQADYGQASLYKWFSDRAGYIYLGENNLSIAYGTIIESVIGSAHNDVIIGNSVDNIIRGGGGNDTLAGGDGTDTAVFGGAYASYRFSVSGGTVLALGLDGVDTLTGFERLQFSDRTVQVSALTSTLPASSFLGTSSDEKLTGTAANDFFYGGTGNDTLTGGGGADTAYFSGNYGQYRVTRSKDMVLVTGPDGSDSLTGIEKLEFADGTAVDTAKLVDTMATASVYRFYNKNTGTHFYTINPSERDAVLKLTVYAYEGEAFKAQTDNAAEQGLAVFRFYNKATGTHFYTANTGERDAVFKLASYAYEGAAYYASATADSGNDPLYRFYNTRTGTHFYTASETERAAVTKLVGFVAEGIAYYVDA